MDKFYSKILAAVNNLFTQSVAFIDNGALVVTLRTCYGAI